MSTELLVNVTPFEIRIARVENGLAEELYVERTCGKGLRGNMYWGKIQRVIPGIQAAFVDLGLKKSGFLYAGDVLGSRTSQEDLDTGDEGESARHEEDYRQNIAPIGQLLREGQEVMVQVSREPISSKGPRVTGMVSLAGRYLVFLPDLDHVGIAKRLEDETERARLLDIAQQIKTPKGGLIIRTVAEGHSLEDLQKDLDFLLRLWADIEKRKKNAGPGSMIHTELNLFLRVMRDFVDDEVEKIHIDSKEAYQSMKTFAESFMPEVVKRLFYYPGDRPIFDVYGVEEEIDRALKRQVKLKSGGSIVIDQAEALIAIDVNSGSFVGSRNLEETSFKTNLEAVHEVVHQLRLRNLGGIIVIDFIDMMDKKNQEKVLEVLNEALKRDKTKTCALPFTSLGLVQLTRKRTRDSLGRMLQVECTHCDSTGLKKSMQTVCYQLFREIVAEARAYPCQKLMVIAHPSLIDLMLGEENEMVVQLEQFLSKEISFKQDHEFTEERYEVVLL
ncbi:MAG: Rne/Rng family ribonuclease [Mariprofundaceae bacterium]|nr:Rne/Rng family ribonuclease [Mariprofundaceae bacterium]